LFLAIDIKYSNPLTKTVYKANIRSSLFLIIVVVVLLILKR